MNIDLMSRARALLGANAAGCARAAADDAPLRSALVAEDARLRHELETIPAGKALAEDGDRYQAAVRSRASICRELSAPS